MNLQQIEAMENKLIRNVFATCWNFAEEVKDCTAYGCDVHHHLFNNLFNSEHYTTWIPQTEQDTADLGVWDCIKLVNNYEKWNSGEIYTKMDAFTVAKMVNYIAGDHLLGKSEHLTRSDAWGSELTTEDRVKIQTELRAYIEELSDWTEFWAEVCDGYDV